MAKLMTWGDSHWGAVKLQPNSRLPGNHWSLKAEGCLKKSRNGRLHAKERS